MEVAEGNLLKPAPLEDSATSKQAIYNNNFKKADSNTLFLLTTHMSEETLEKVMC